MAPDQVVHRGAKASDHPCELYLYHVPNVVRTQGHHLYPEFLQKRLFGETVLDDIVWLCGNCHDSVHEWLSWLLEEARKPAPDPPPRARALAAYVFSWYRTVSEGMSPR